MFCQGLQASAGSSWNKNFKTMILIWSLFIPQPFFPFRFFISPPSLSRKTNRANRAKAWWAQALIWFPLNRFCIQKLIKNKLARKPDDTKHRVVKKIQGVPLNLNKAFLCEKKQAKTMEWTWVHITCCRRMGWLPGTWHSMNSNCSAVRGVDCEHHMNGEVINQ